MLMLKTQWKTIVKAGLAKSSLTSVSHYLNLRPVSHYLNLKPALHYIGNISNDCQNSHRLHFILNWNRQRIISLWHRFRVILKHCRPNQNPIDVRSNLKNKSKTICMAHPKTTTDRSELICAFMFKSCLYTELRLFIEFHAFSMIVADVPLGFYSCVIGVH